MVPYGRVLFLRFFGLGTMNMDQLSPNHDPSSRPDGSESSGDAGHQSQRRPIDLGAAIARQLTGELYCIECGYNLRGLSIRSNCSECGVPVRATILGIVDPHADELTPLYAPKISAIGLNVWSIGAMVAILAIWVLQGAFQLRDMSVIVWSPVLVPWIGVGGLTLSMLGACTMIRSHSGVHRLEAIRSAFSVSLYAPLVFVYAALYLNNPESIPGFDRSVLRIAMFVLVAGIIYGMRPQAVGLAVRSVVVRTGRVDRQSLLAVLAAIGIASVGDLIRVVGGFILNGTSDVLAIISAVVIALGSVLFTVGMMNICLDTLRLYPVLVRPGVGLSDIFETNRQKSARTSEK